MMSKVPLRHIFRRHALPEKQARKKKPAGMEPAGWIERSCFSRKSGGEYRFRLDQFVAERLGD
ncbi:hypothetical protein, partial [Mesorhizobium sp. M7A.F.Ca.AU.001.01.1.1]|uniref:hypothetical protein n=1 Tax=Mesorhizobium sp. M7A.F.Ca.AU.001.01.1.1 TaxID=2496675 RepID=UPI0013E38885